MTVKGQRHLRLSRYHPTLRSCNKPCSSEARKAQFAGRIKRDVFIKSLKVQSGECWQHHEPDMLKINLKTVDIQAHRSRQNHAVSTGAVSDL